MHLLTGVNCHPYISVGTVPGSSPPAILGGHTYSGKTATDSISLYKVSDNSWKKVANLPSARGRVAVATTVIMLSLL